MADGILLEKHGLPAAVICTESFHGSAGAMARIQGFPDYHYLVTPHPVSNLTPEQLRERAEQLLAQVVDTLGRQG